MAEMNRRSSDKSIDRELGEITAAIKQIGTDLRSHIERGEEFRDYQKSRNHEILNEINAVSLSNQLMQQKMEETSASLNHHNERLDELHESHLKAKGALKMLSWLGLPGAGVIGSAGAYFSKLLGPN